MMWCVFAETIRITPLLNQFSGLTGIALISACSFAIVILFLVSAFLV